MRAEGAGWGMPKLFFFNYYFASGIDKLKHLFSSFPEWKTDKLNQVLVCRFANGTDNACKIARVAGFASGTDRLEHLFASFASGTDNFSAPIFKFQVLRGERTSSASITLTLVH